MTAADMIDGRCGPAASLAIAGDDAATDSEGLGRRFALSALGGLLAAAFIPDLAAARSSQTVSQAGRNKASYLAAKAAFNARDLDRYAAYYALGHRLMTQAAGAGQDGIGTFFEASLNIWPDMQIVVETALAEDDWVIGRSVSTATHKVAINGIEPSGKEIITGFWDLVRFDAAGLMIQTWTLTDRLSQMQQLAPGISTVQESRLPPEPGSGGDTLLSRE